MTTKKKNKTKKKQEQKVNNTGSYVPSPIQGETPAGLNFSVKHKHVANCHIL